MALKFNPPEELVNAYLQRPSPGQEASAGIQQALQTYAQQRVQEQQEAAQKHQQGVADFNATKDYLPEDQVASAAKAAGLNIPAPVISSGTPSGYDVNASTPTEQSNLMSMPSEHPQISPIIQASLDAGHPNHSGIRIPTSKAGLAKYKTGLETQKLTQGMDANEPASFDEVNTTFEAAGKPQLGAELIRNAQSLGQNAVQRKSVDAAIRGLGVAAQAGRGQYFNTQSEINQAKFQNDLNQQANRALNPNVAGGTLRPQQERLNRIGRAETLIQQMDKQKGGGDTRQIRELATSLATVLTGGNVVAQEQIQELIPRTYQGNINKFIETLTNNPTGLEQQEFVRRFADTLKREKTTISTQIKGAQTASLPALDVLKQRNPKSYKEIVQTNLDNPQYQTTPTVSSQEEYDALPSGAEYMSPDGRPHRKK